jgi:hypothetical protein
MNTSSESEKIDIAKLNKQISQQIHQLNWYAEDRRRLTNRYLSLMQKCLTGTIYEDPPLKALGSEIFDSRLREYGWDWPSVAHTMIGEKRLANVRSLTESVLGNGIEGDFIEMGVKR